MTLPDRTPLGADDMAKLHPSTWEQECRLLREQNTELALQVLASDGQAAEANEARLIAEGQAKALREQNLIMRTNAHADAECIGNLERRVAKLEAALQPFDVAFGEDEANLPDGETVRISWGPIYDCTLTLGDLRKARAALQEGK